MLHSINVGRKIPIDYQACPEHINDSFSEHAAGVLQITERYKPSDRKIKAGRDLFSAGEKGDAIYSFIEGWVAIYSLLEDGHRHIQQFALPGTVLGFVPSRGAVMNCGALALTDAVVSITTHEGLRSISLKQPAIGMRLAGLISQDRNRANDYLSSISRGSARVRVAHLLLDLFIRSRMRWPGHCIEEMHLPLTQEDIGDATNLTGVHVNRVLRELRKDRIVEFHYRRLSIMNPDKLIDVAGIDPHVAVAWRKNQFSTEGTG
jgi:CRP/FNR family transcriptional regulator